MWGNDWGVSEGVKTPEQGEQFTGSAIHEGEVEMEHNDHDEEAHQPKPVTTPEKPSIQEIRNHELTHIPCPAWCKHCVRSLAIEDRRRRTDIEKERDSDSVNVCHGLHVFVRGCDTGITR